MKLTITNILAVILTLSGSALLMGADYMYWDSNFSLITLQNIQTRYQVREDSSSTTLFTTGDMEISADNTTAAQLSYGSDALVTEYKLTFDGDGSSATGGPMVDFTSYDSFLSSVVSVTYVPDDNDVVVTLFVRASNYIGQLANAGTYTATQTLTAVWVGP